MIRQLVWTPELVARFWDGLANSSLGEMTFGREAGPGLLRVIAAELSLSGRYLDFGAGDGDLLSLLLAKGYKAAAFEPSQERTRILRDRLSRFPSFLGCVAPEDDISFDTVICSEVIEHVLDDDLSEVFDTLRRLVAPDGRLIVTTPNKEVLDHQMAYDPVNGNFFHRWQHQRAYSDLSLEKVFAPLGFETELMHRVEFSPRVFSQPDRVANDELDALFLTRRSVVLGNGGTLVYVGRKSSRRRPWHYPVFAPVRSTIDTGANGRQSWPPVGVVAFEAGEAILSDAGLFSFSLPSALADLAMADPASVLLYDGATPYPPALHDIAAVRASDVGGFTVEAGAITFSPLRRSPKTTQRQYHGVILAGADADEARFLAAMGTGILPHLAERLAARLVRKGKLSCAVYGAGDAGQVMVRACRNNGIAVDCLIDGHPAVQGCMFDGIPVRSVEEAISIGCRRFLLGTVSSARGMADRLRALVEANDDLELYSFVDIDPTQ